MDKKEKPESLSIPQESNEEEYKKKLQEKSLETYIYPAYDHDLEEEYDAIRSIN